MQDKPIGTRSSLQTFENSLILLSMERAPGAVVLLLTALESLLKQIPQLEAEDGTRTRDPQLGKLVLYQLSYFRC